MRREDASLIVSALKRIHEDLIGRPAEVRGRPEIAGFVIGVALNPHGVVIVTLKARDTTIDRKARTKVWPLRLRLPAEAMTFGERPEPTPKRRVPHAYRTIPQPVGLALDRMGRLAL